MKKSIKIKEELTDSTVYFCYGNDEYLKVSKKIGYENPCELQGGLSIKFDGGTYMVVVNDNFKTILDFKGTMVHEISHLVTFIMKYNAIKNDEFRSFMFEYFYKKITPWFDKVLANPKS